MSRFYLILPNNKSAIETIEELKELGVPEDHIHIVSKDSNIAEKTHTYKATEYYTTDAWHMGVQGMIFGAIFAACMFLFETLTFEPLLFFKIVFSGSIIGCISCLIIGASREEPHIEEHHDDVEHGSSIVIADMYRGQELWTLQKIHQHHPEATIEKAGVFT